MQELNAFFSQLDSWVNGLSEGYQLVVYAAMIGVPVFLCAYFTPQCPKPQYTPHCPECGYSLIGLHSTTCPECGRSPTLDKLLSEIQERT